MTARLFTDPRLARRKKRALALVCVSAMLALQGCHDFEPGEGGGGQAQQQPLIYTNAELDAGFNMASGAPASACFDFTADVFLMNLQTLRSFVAYSLDDLRDKFVFYYQGGRSSDAWADMLTDVYAQVNPIEHLGRRDVLYIPIYFENVSARVDPFAGRPLQGADGLSSCEEVSAASNDGVESRLDEFIAQCGTHFLSEQRYGGYAILALSIASMPLGVQRALRHAAEVEVIGAFEPTRAATIISRIAQILEDAGLPRYMVIKVAGIPEPEQRFMSGAQLSLDAWSDYVDQVVASYSEPLANGRLEDPRYGFKVEQRFQAYGADLLYQCAEIDHDEFEQLRCYQSLVDSRSPLKSVHVRQVKAHLDFMLNPVNSARVEYRDGPEGAQYYRNLRDSISQCEARVEVLRDRCDDLLATAPLELCDQGCELPDECDGSFDIYTRLHQGPRYDILPLMSFPSSMFRVYDHWLSAGESASIAPVDDRICVFAGMQGPFDSTAESIRLHSGLGLWTFDVRAGLGSNGYQRGVFGQAYCVDREAFVTSGVNAWLETRFHEHDTDSNTTFTEPSLGDHVIGLGGISGRLKGSGERSFVTQSEDVGLKSKFSSRSLQGRLRTWAISFGLSNFQDSNARWYRLGPQANLVELEVSSQDALSPHSDLETMGGLRTVQAMLAPKDEALCYLTRVGGRFDGGGEKILIKEREGMWILEVTAGIENGQPKPVSAAVRCLKYVQ